MSMAMAMAMAMAAVPWRVSLPRHRSYQKNLAWIIRHIFVQCLHITDPCWNTSMIYLFSSSLAPTATCMHYTRQVFLKITSLSIWHEFFAVFRCNCTHPYGCLIENSMGICYQTKKYDSRLRIISEYNSLTNTKYMVAVEYNGIYFMFFEKKNGMYCLP